ncbi:unnamed protein product [Brassica rapa subsp. trilocularis]
MPKISEWREKLLNSLDVSGKGLVGFHSSITRMGKHA